LQICIFEDENYTNLQPLVYSRPVYDLLCGVESLKQRIISNYGNVKVSLHCRPYLEETVKRNNLDYLVNRIEDTECLFINGRNIAPQNLSELLPHSCSEDKVFVNEDTVVAAYLTGTNLKYKSSHIKDLFSIDDFNNLPVKILDIKCANYLWDIIFYNGTQISLDFNRFKMINKENFVNQVEHYVHLVNKENIFIGKNVIIKPGVVIDASDGPVIIDDDVFIYPNSFIEGPCFIGASSKIKAGATIYGNTSIGKVCKIGGEVEGSVFMDYSNKQHAGFIGHSYIGSWVNLGAGTNNSDLKNNYSIIKIKLNNKEVDSNHRFLGMMIGDHSKSAINTKFNTGSVIGFSCNIFLSGFPDKYVPSFSWGGDSSSKVYDVNKALETARIVINRRKIDFDAVDEKLFRFIFELTHSDREKRGY
jgi:UDP-N-acetylglucosamine diphosphorylase/glucosamine-1-phosphate N-acetyltransferase